MTVNEVIQKSTREDGSIDMNVVFALTASSKTTLFRDWCLSTIKERNLTVVYQSENAYPTFTKACDVERLKVLQESIRYLDTAPQPFLVTVQGRPDFERTNFVEQLIELNKKREELIEKILKSQ